MIENKGQQIEAENNAVVNEVLEFENKPLFAYSTINNSNLILNDLLTKPDTRLTFIELIKSSRKLVGDYTSLNPEEVTKYKERISFLSDFIYSDEAQRDSGFHAGSAFNIINGLTKGLMDPLRKGETDFKKEFEKTSDAVSEFISKADINNLGFPATVALKRLIESHSLIGLQDSSPNGKESNDIRNKINEIKLNANKYSIFNTKEPVKAQDRAIEFINCFAVSAPLLGREYKTGKKLETVDDKIQELKISLSFKGVEKRNDYSMQILEEALGYGDIAKLNSEDFTKICLVYKDLFEEYYDTVKVNAPNGSIKGLIPTEHLEILKTRAGKFLEKIDYLNKVNPSVSQNIFATDSLYQVLKKVNEIDENSKEIKSNFQSKSINKDFFKDKEHYFATDVSSNVTRLYIDNFKSTRPMDQRFTFDTLASQVNSSLDKFWDYMKFLDYSISHAKNFSPLVIRSTVNILENLFIKHFDFLTDSSPDTSIYSKNPKQLAMLGRILGNIKNSFYSSNSLIKIEDPSPLMTNKLSNIDEIVKTKASANPLLEQSLKSSEI